MHALPIKNETFDRHRSEHSTGGWKFTPGEKVGLSIFLLVVLGFGANLERRTALRRVPMTDLGVFASAAAAVQEGQNIYTATDWHGWHYVYPPALAILFCPFALPVQSRPPQLEPGTLRTAENTPWGFKVDKGRSFYGLHKDHLHFFWIVGVWFLISVAMTVFSAHLLACALQGRRWNEPPSAEASARQLWWRLRWLPPLICITSIGTEFSRGQVGVIMLLAVSAGFYLAGRGYGLRAGICFSIPAVIKLVPPLILLLPLWNRRWRTFYGIALGLVLTLVLIPVLRLGAVGTVTAYQNWFNVLVKPALGGGQNATLALELTNINATDNQSLLAFIHNWTYHHLPAKYRPPQAAQSERRAVYFVSCAMLLTFGAVVGFRRQRSSRELLIIIGILIGLVFVVCPTVHNFYYLLLMPLLAGLIYQFLDESPAHRLNRSIPVTLGFFLLIDLLARIPGIGPWLRDCGLPFVSLVMLMITGLSVLLRKEINETTGCELRVLNPLVGN